MPNPYFPASYQAYTPNNYMMPSGVSQAGMPAAQPQAQTQPQTQAQNQQALTYGGVVVVPSEEDVKRYPVAPGNVVTFRLDNKPILIEKSMSWSQFDSPRYERYKLIKEDMPQEAENVTPTAEYALKTDVEGLRGDIEKVTARIDKLKEKIVKAEKSLEDALKPKKPAAKLTKNEDTEDDDL